MVKDMSKITVEIIVDGKRLVIELDKEHLDLVVSTTRQISPGKYQAGKEGMKYIIGEMIVERLEYMRELTIG